MILLIKGIFGLVPVLLFLAVLLALDSFKLVSLRSVLQTILVGTGVAVVALVLNRALLDTVGIDVAVYSRYVAPIVEEGLKAAFLVVLIRQGRIGFLVDAAILGFAIGTGFALIENLYYLQAMDDGSLLLWIIRGFGTALLHGFTTAIVGIVVKDLLNRHDSQSLLLFFPALFAAIAIHSAYNHFFLPPLLSALVLLVVLPLVVLAVFSRSERATREWLGIGLDSDAELLELVLEGEITESRVGEYLNSLKSRFSGAVVADMLCLLQIHLELSLRAKGILMAREAGISMEITDDVRANLEELEYLERSIGATGRQTIEPVLNMRTRDLWQLYMLGK